MPASPGVCLGAAEFPLVVYHEQQTLRAADLQTQQQELRAMRRRHNRYLHGYGIVCGLEVQKTIGGLVVRSGLALDGRGRELLLTDDQEITQEELKNAQGGGDLVIWIASHEYRKASPPAVDGSGGTCRVVESARLLSSQSDDTVYAANERRGFVFLGQVIGSDSGLDLVDRKYVPLVAEQVTSPGGHVRLSLGPGPEIPNRRFGLALRASLNAPFVDRLSIDATGNAHVVGDLAVMPVQEVKPGQQRKEGPPSVVQVAVESSGPNLQRGVHFAEPGLPPKEARPWRVYRVSYPAKDLPGATIDELRFEIAHPGKQGIPHSFHWSVGVGDGTDFSPRVIAAADQSLTVIGDLWVVGGLVIMATPEKGTEPGGAPGQIALAGNPQGLAAQINSKATLAGNQLSVSLTLTNTGAGPVILAGVHATVDVTQGRSTRTYFLMLDQGLVLNAASAKAESGSKALDQGPANPTLGKLYLNVWGVGPAGFLRYQAVQDLTIIQS